MKIIKNNYKLEKENALDEFKRSQYLICQRCNSEFEFDPDDTYIGALGCRYVKCPCCGEEIMLDDGIKLTTDNLQFPTHYFSYKDGVKLSDEEVNRYVKECIRSLRYSKDKDFYATQTGTGDTQVFVFRYDGDEEYYVYVGKGGYVTHVPFDEVDYKC